MSKYRMRFGSIAWFAVNWLRIVAAVAIVWIFLVLASAL